MLNPPKNKKSLKTFGIIGEDYAVEFLKSRGYRIIKRNFRSKFGEIDIVTIDGEVLAFVEVKTRWSLKFGMPEEAVTNQKIAKIKRAADYFNLLNPNLPKKQRIDVVAIEIRAGKVRSAKIIQVT